MTEQPHPLTDEIIHTMWGKGDPSQKFEYRLARAAANWQLEEVTKWLKATKSTVKLCPSVLAVQLEQAMRPQRQQEKKLK